MCLRLSYDCGVTGQGQCS